MIADSKAPTRAAVLELMNEETVVREAYVFLDEKRLLLASELLRQLDRYRQIAQQLAELNSAAREAMQAAIRYHGLDGLQVYPSASGDVVELRQSSRNFMGVELIEIEIDTEPDRFVHPTPVNASAAAERCGRLYCSIFIKSAIQAGLSGNLYRLLTEYRVTERRSRALENIILPEIDQALREMTAHLDELDLEDAIRVRQRSHAS